MAEFHILPDGLPGDGLSSDVKLHLHILIDITGYVLLLLWALHPNLILKINVWSKTKN